MLGEGKHEISNRQIEASMSIVKDSFLEAQRVLAEFVGNEENLLKVEEAGDILVHAFQEGRKVLSCGNGGSMCDAMHFAEELTGKFREDRPALSAMAIADVSHFTCVGNDFGFEHIFSRYVEAHGQEGDVLLAISTSGNSKNVIRAIETAKEKKMKVIGLSGKSGGCMNEGCDVHIRVPWYGYSDRIQEIHIKVIHILIEYVESKLFRARV